MLQGLWDVQTVLFAGLTCFVILIALMVLFVTSRRVRHLMDEVQGLRREMRLVDDALQSLTTSLQDISRERGGVQRAIPEG